MAEIWILAAVGALVLTYHLGKRKGVKETNREAAGPGTWIELRKEVKAPGIGDDEPETIRVGTQGVITSIDKWGRYSFWIAEPWTKFKDGIPAVYAIDDYSAFRIRAPWRIDEDIHADTMQALANWTLRGHEMRERLFPPGWWEFRRRLERGY